MIKDVRWPAMMAQMATQAVVKAPVKIALKQWGVQEACSLFTCRLICAAMVFCKKLPYLKRSSKPLESLAGGMSDQLLALYLMSFEVRT